MVRSTSIKHLVKRHGHTEPYDEKKVYASVYSAAINAHYLEKDAEREAAFVLKKINAAVSKRDLIDANSIRILVIQSIRDSHITVLYEHHLDVC
ncbi:MAG: transcriptional regulator NrdR family protein [Candidatus Woesearchaeota archaeon]|jgi:transcriptional regulator NrdR family protein